MLSRSYFNLLNLYNYSIDRTVVPHVCSVLSDFSSGTQSFGETRSMKQERRVIVANQLPIKAIPNPSQEFQWRFEWDTDALVLQLKDGFPAGTKVVYIGGFAELRLELFQLQTELLQELRRSCNILRRELKTELLPELFGAPIGVVFSTNRSFVGLQ